MNISLSHLGGCLLCGGAAAFLRHTNCAPLSWGTAAACIWLLFAVSKGRARLQNSDKLQLAWGLLSVAAFIAYLRVVDPSFAGWEDVYFFCGRQGQFCSCHLRWNLAGWCKAAVLWNFVLTSTLALQKLIIQVGLKGLLPGEEVVTKESFISICWRLIPYWLNNWEQQWGAECSSMMFELPHFTVELLVVLPLVQVLCARMRILALPAGRFHRPALLRLPAAVRGNARQMAMLAPDAIRGMWRPMAGQQHFFNRARSNLRMLLLVLAVIALALFNAIRVPLTLEAQIFRDGRASVLMAAAERCGESAECWAAADLGPVLHAFGAAHNVSCREGGHLERTFQKHGSELLKMRSPSHKDLIPLVETALAVMRLSCERFFVLVSVFAAYLVFHSHVPQWFRALIRANHRLSKLFQQVILNSFPAVCWLYGAGVVFSSFVSLVFWGTSARRAYTYLRKMASDVKPEGLQDASEEDVERMNRQCAICWSAMWPAEQQPGSTPRRHRSKALPCSHAFHEDCIHRWLKQCHEQGRQPTCPLCNAPVTLKVRYRLPLTRRTQQDALEQAVDLGELGNFGLEGEDAVGEAEGGVANARLADGGSAREATEGSQSTSSADGLPDAVRIRSSEAPASCSSSEDVNLHSVEQQTARLSALRPIQTGRHECNMDPTGSGSGSGHNEVCNARHSQQPGVLGNTSPSGTGQAPLGSSPVGSRLPSSLEATASGWSEGRCSPSRRATASTAMLSELSAAVHRDRQRAAAYLEYCRAQESQLQAKIQRCTGVMTEAWQTATELLRNAEHLEGLLRDRQAGLEPSQEAGRPTAAGPSREQPAASFETLWQRQQLLWAKSQELHKEGADLMQP